MSSSAQKANPPTMPAINARDRRKRLWCRNLSAGGDGSRYAHCAAVGEDILLRHKLAARGNPHRATSTNKVNGLLSRVRREPITVARAFSVIWAFEGPVVTKPANHTALSGDPNSKYQAPRY